MTTAATPRGGWMRFPPSMRARRRRRWSAGASSLTAARLNRQIKADNALLRELKAEFKKLAALVARAVPAIAEGLEKLRSRGADLLLSALSHSQRQISYSKISRRMEAGAGALHRSGAANQGKRARSAKHWLPRKRHCQYTM